VTAERPAEPGETCTCGEPAVVVFVTERWGDVGYCGVPRVAPEPECDDEPTSADCRGGRHPMLEPGAAACEGCACWCHAGEALRRPSPDPGS